MRVASIPLKETHAVRSTRDQDTVGIQPLAQSVTDFEQRRIVGDAFPVCQPSLGLIGRDDSDAFVGGEVVLLGIDAHCDVVLVRTGQRGGPHSSLASLGTQRQKHRIGGLAFSSLRWGPLEVHA